MHRPRSAAMMVATLSLVLSAPATAGTSEAIARGRTLLEHDDPRAAIAVLEGALTAEPGARGEVLDLLRKAYSSAVQKAEAAGQRQEAEILRDNLEILDRKPRVGDRALPVLSSAPDSDGAAPATPDTHAPRTQSRPENPARPVSRTSEATSSPPAISPAAPRTDSRSRVAAADAAFRAEHYDEAGRLYAALDKQNTLPKSRRDHWAYCRWVDVVRRINARPNTPEQWGSIDLEIEQIRKLSPKNWYGEYLRDRAAERSAVRRTSQSNKVVVRGAAPEEPASADPPASAPPAPGPATKPADPAASSAAPSRTAGTTGQWQVLETASFRILHADPVFAARVAHVAESAREALVKRWSGSAPHQAWSPRCDIYLYPSAKIFSRMTGQPEQSPGFSTMGMNGGRIVARRVNLRTDHPNLIVAILPHEITHIVLADLFPQQQIPRWADEGMAVLSEPLSEQRLRAADLEKPLANGQLFKLDELMVMDYPDGKYWSLYYAQSVSLTRFLVEQGSAAQFVQFVQGSQKNGLDSELRRVYKIEGFADLQKRWLAYAQAKSSEMTASTKPANNPDTTAR